MDNKEIERIWRRLKDDRAMVKSMTDKVQEFTKTDEFKALPDEIKGVIYAVCWEGSQLADLLISEDIMIARKLLGMYGNNAPKSDIDTPTIDDSTEKV